MEHDRYILDVLYGKLHLPDYLWKILPSPELQRLREVRLCNINSLCLTGGANINRYEHAIGTAHLALQCLRRWPTMVPLGVQERIVLAALLHDINSGAFGHSVQYVMHPEGFEHESVDHMFTAVDKSDAFSYQQVSLEPVFFGMPKHLHILLKEETFRAVAELIAGKGYYGQLISAEMDLDNIDNVFRLAYHIGITRDTETPLQLAQSLWIESGDLTIREAALPLIERWQAVRQRLYHFLLLNPHEFSAKCMLEQALTQNTSKQEFFWHDVDFELIKRIAATSSDASFITSRLMVGNLYGCLGIYETSDIQWHDRLAPGRDRVRLERELSVAVRSSGVRSLASAVIRIHTIKDVAKTDRRVTVRTDTGAIVSVGTNSRRTLIGVFLENRHLSIDGFPSRIARQCLVQHPLVRTLSAVVGSVVPLDLYAEAATELAP